MSNTLWYQHGSHQFHVSEGSPAHRQLAKEGATEIEAPCEPVVEEAPKKAASRKKPAADA